VRTLKAAQSLSSMLITVGKALGIVVNTLVTDGTQPVGRGIGPALEARDVLTVLQNAANAPEDLRQRSLLLAAGVLELGEKARPGDGLAMARRTLESGEAWRKFQAICAAQGGLREPPTARYTHVLVASRAGYVVAIDNRRLARIAKLAGAPKALAAGLLFHAPLGTQVEVGQPLMTIHAESPGELAYALAYAETQQDVVLIGHS
jgi:thymidine phosphorylase